MQVTKGTLKNTQSGKALNFSLNPASYEINRSYEFQVEPRLGAAAPLVAYRCAGAATLKFQLVLDQDVDNSESVVKDAVSFLDELSKVYDETASTAPLEFKQGGVVFQGFARTVRWTAKRFNPKGEPTSAVLDMELIAI